MFNRADGTISGDSDLLVREFQVITLNDNRTLRRAEEAHRRDYLGVGLTGLCCFRRVW